MSTTVSRAAREPDPRDRLIALPAIVGGALVSVGTLLPWLSFFAGLESYSGIFGLHGRVLLAGGVVSVAGGIAMLVRPDHRLRRCISALGLLLVLFTGWLLVGLRSTTRELAMHPLLIARPGVGLFVALLGALIVAGTLLRELRRFTRARREAHVSSRSRY